MPKGKPHHLSCTPTWNSWKGMHDRTKHRPNYEHVKVCARWDDFLLFLEDMGERPEGMTIDRIDGSGDYEPENCRWADTKTQLENRKCTDWITFDGITQTQAQWARELGISRTAMNNRLKRGWSIERALTTPLRRYPRPADASS